MKARKLLQGVNIPKSRDVVNGGRIPVILTAETITADSPNAITADIAKGEMAYYETEQNQAR